MKRLEQHILKLPTGVLSLIAVLLASYSPPLTLVVMAVCLVFAEIILGYIKHQAAKSLVSKNKALYKKMKQLEKEKQQVEKVAQSIKQFGHKVFPLWSQQLQECIDISTQEVDQVCHYFTNTVTYLQQGGQFSHGQLMEGEYQLITDQVVDNAQAGIKALQYQDRVSQIMSNINASMIDLSFKCDSKYPIDIDQFLHISSANYTTKNERDAYFHITGKAAIDASSLEDNDEVTLF